MSNETVAEMKKALEKERAKNKKYENMLKKNSIDITSGKRDEGEDISKNVKGLNNVNINKNNFTFKSCLKARNKREIKNGKLVVGGAK